MSDHAMPLPTLHRIQRAALRAWEAGLGERAIVDALDDARGQAKAVERVERWLERQPPPDFRPLPADPE